MTHICVSKLTIIGSENGLSPGRRQAIIWTNDGILLIRPLGTNFSEILIEIHTFSFKKMHLKMSSGKLRPFWLGLNVLNEKCPQVCILFHSKCFYIWVITFYWCFLSVNLMIIFGEITVNEQMTKHGTHDWFRWRPVCLMSEVDSNGTSSDCKVTCFSIFFIHHYFLIEYYTVRCNFEKLIKSCIRRV